MSVDLPFKPTEEQEAARQQAKLGSGSIMLRALAGCAKTSTLALMGREIRVPAMALVFNKRNQLEMKDRFGANFKVQTLNGLGFGAWTRANPGISFEMDDKKLGRLVSQVAKERKLQLSTEQWDGLRQLAEKVMQAGIVPEGSGPPGLLPDDPLSWWEVAQEVGLDKNEFSFLYELAREVVEKNIELARQGKISFSDQIYCSALLGGRFPQFPVLFVDESQDLSPLNHRMLQLSLRPGGRLVAVGDSRQAIYAWRGADGRSMETIRAMKPEGEWSDLPLQMTFRCPKLVVERQQARAPGFRAHSANAEGAVNHFLAPSSLVEWDGWGWADLEGAKPFPGASAAILCRNNGPLLALAFKLIRQGVGVHVLGRDISKGLISLSKKIAKEDEEPADNVRALVEDWRQGEASLLLANGQEEKIDSVNDKAECLKVVLDAGVRTAGELREVLKKLFEREEGLVTLSSIHKFKGLERDLVLILDPWRIAGKRARERGGVELEQELNLRYVAETRTRHTLLLANLEDFR